MHHLIAITGNALDIERFCNDLARFFEIFEYVVAQHLRHDVADGSRLDGTCIDFLARHLDEQSIEKFVLTATADHMDGVVLATCDLLDLSDRLGIALC